MTTKHLLRTAVVALSALTVSTVSAQFSTFPPLSKPGTEKSRSSMQRVSPNLDKESGIMIYAATSADGTMYNSWVSLRSKQASTLTRYFPWLDYTGNDDVYRTSVQPATGAYNPDDGKYYVMLTFVYDCIWDAKNTFNYIPEHWYSIDLDKGAEIPSEVANLKEWSKEQGWVSYSMDSNAPHWGLWMDMSFDPIDGTMYAMAQSEEPISNDNPYHSAIVQVQLHDGKYRVKKELTGRYYLGFTYDLDGKVYAARWTTNASDQINGSVIVELDRKTFEEKGVVAELKKDEMPFKLCYNGTLDVDRATGELYYAGSEFDSGRQYLFKVNPKTGSCEYLSSLSYDNIVGMHIPYVGTENRNAPARVSDLRTEFAADGSNSITIRWTNPSTKWNLEDLASISGVKIYRDDMKGEPIADVKENVAPGAESSYVDNTAAQGLHTYYVIPYNENGDGISDSIAAFVGRDTPDAPMNVDGYGQGAFSMIYWNAPVTGLHNGWFDNTTLKYTVTRSDGVVIAENITETQVYDNMLNDAPMAMYTYTVTSSNDDGKGGSAVSGEMLCGAAYSVPYTFDFSLSSERSGFSGYNPQGWSGWSQGWQNDWGLYIESTSKYDEYLLTPQFNVEAGHTYRVTWNLRFDQNTNVHTYELTAGESGEKQIAFAEDMFDETETGSVYQETVTTGEYTADADGKCYFGFHVTTEGSAWDKVSVIGMSVEEVLENDLQAKSLTGFPRVLRGKAQDYTVSVFNSGRNDQKDFKVQTGYTTRKGEFVVLGETTCAETVPSNEARKISVPTTVDFENGTRFDMCGRVIVEGDEYTGNDIGPATSVLVEDIEGAEPFNAEFVGGKLTSGDGYGDTNVPFTTYKPNTTSVTIYPKSLLATSQKAPYEISRIGYTAFSKMNIDPCDVKVYMGTTEDEMFNGYPVENAISPSDLELVYEGYTSAMYAGSDGLSIKFEKPYVYDGTKNLVVALEVVCNSGTGGYNIFWNKWDSESGKYQSLKTNSTSWDLSDVARWEGMPDLHLAVKGQNIGDGVDGISSENAFGMSISGRNVFVSGDVKALHVYDLTGRKVCAYDVNGSGHVALNVPGGIYLIKAVDAAGNTRTLKAAVR